MVGDNNLSPATVACAHPPATRGHIQGHKRSGGGGGGNWFSRGRISIAPNKWSKWFSVVVEIAMATNGTKLCCQWQHRGAWLIRLLIHKCWVGHIGMVGTNASAKGRRLPRDRGITSCRPAHQVKEVEKSEGEREGWGKKAAVEWDTVKEQTGCACFSLRCHDDVLWYMYRVRYSNRFWTMSWGVRLYPTLIEDTCLMITSRKNDIARDI